MPTWIVVYWHWVRDGPAVPVAIQEHDLLSTMQRYLLAALTIALLATAAWLFIQDPSSNASAKFYCGLCMRAGLVCGALWLAFPQVVPLLAKRPSPFTLAIGLGLIMVIINPRYALLVGVLVAAIGVLQAVKWLFAPLNTKSPQSSDSKDK